jgi:hypothetical protein
MKNILFPSVLLFMSVSLFAQTSLTHQNNALISGDSCTYREIQFADPGNAGPDQIWDYSKIQFTGKSIVSFIQPDPSQKTTGVEDNNILLKESGYDYSLTSFENRLEERGYVNKGKNLTFEYSVPVIKMKYPFFYGDQTITPFTGVAYYNGKNKIDFSGNYTVAADAYGTLILPDVVIKNTLRVKIIKKGWQISMCSSTETNIIKYYWYAPGCRYPVLNISIVENRYRGGAPEILKTAYVTAQQLNDGNTIAGSNDPGTKIEKSDVSVILFPNPFDVKLTYNYFLRKQLHVSIELYDMSGKYSLRLLKNQIQSEGLHTGILDGFTHGLTPGVYYIRFTFDKQVIIGKVIKI